jgi:hypothetical protein
MWWLTLCAATATTAYVTVTLTHEGRIRMLEENELAFPPHFQPIYFSISYRNTSHAFVSKLDLQSNKLFGNFVKMQEGVLLDMQSATVVGIRDHPFTSSYLTDTFVTNYDGKRLVYMLTNKGHRICLNLHCTYYHFTKQQALRIDPIANYVYILTTT